MTLEVDGREVPAAGSVLDCVLAAGVELPHLCKDDNLAAIGACRTCLVEADGRIVAACATPAPGIKAVDTRSARAVRLRRGVLSLTAAMRTGTPVRAAGPESYRLDAALRLEGMADTFASAGGRSRIDASNPFFVFSEASCILCGRCVSACQSLQHISAIGMSGRGIATRVTPGTGASFRDSSCTSCGSCVAACPTDALRPKEGGIS